MTQPRPAATRQVRPARGLTLLELLVALAVVAVLASLALPSFGAMLVRHRLKAAAENLAVDLAELRFQATQRGQALHLHYATGTSWCYALATVSGCDCHVAQNCQLKTVRAKDHPGVQLVEAQNVLFDAAPDTRVGSGSAVLQAADGAQLRVGLSRLGRPNVCAPGVAVPGYPHC
ncbi:MAG: prepilin-type N-terminal cleavage/methylation domain-containing protein [Rubrivivax sp.]